MTNIRSKGTTPERIICKELRKRKVYFSTQATDVIGIPDIIFRRRKVVVFIDSDFWHYHPKRCVIPKTNQGYWINKLQSNRRRDLKINRILKKSGWKVIRIWEFNIKHDVKKCVDKIIQSIRISSVKLD